MPHPVRDHELASTIVRFWFEDSGPGDWFSKRPEFDALIRDRFAATHDRALAGDYDHWEDDPQACLALVVVLDQFPRNMFREDPRAYRADAKALGVARRAVAAGHHRALTLDQCKFMFLPFEHSEALDDQKLGVELMREFCDEESVGYALRHLEIVERFGRFPHRNAVLGRESTAQERDFLLEPGSGF